MTTVQLALPGTYVKHSKKILVSYGIGNIVSDLLGAVLAVMLFAFYETEVGLATSLTGTALIIFAIWDGINDPVVGYISDRPNRFTRRWGRRPSWSGAARSRCIP